MTRFVRSLGALSCLLLFGGCSGSNALTPDANSASPIERWMAAEQQQLVSRTGIALTLSIDLEAGTVTLSNDGETLQVVSIPSADEGSTAE